MTPRAILSTVLASSLLLAGSVAQAQTVTLRPSTYRTLTAAPLRRVSPTFAVPVARLRTTSVMLVPAPPPAPEPARPGQVACRVTENGTYAPATLEVSAQGRVVARGDCSGPLDLPAGTYVATVTLESAVDHPQQSMTIRVPEGGVASVTASFATSILEVRFTKNRESVFGTAFLRRGGVVVATLGSGVPARVSAGTYELLERYRTEDRVVQVTVAPGQRLAVRADF